MDNQLLIDGLAWLVMLLFGLVLFNTKGKK